MDLVSLVLLHYSLSMFIVAKSKVNYSTGQKVNCLMGLVNKKFGLQKFVGNLDLNDSQVIVQSKMTTNECNFTLKEQK